MALVVGARHSGIVQQGGPRLEIHLVGDRTAVPEGGRTEDPRRLGGDPTGNPQIDL